MNMNIDMYLICILYTLYTYQIISYYVSIKYHINIYSHVDRECVKPYRA